MSFTYIQCNVQLSAWRRTWFITTRMQTCLCKCLGSQRRSWALGMMSSDSQSGIISPKTIRAGTSEVFPAGLNEMLSCKPGDPISKSSNTQTNKHTTSLDKRLNNEGTKNLTSTQMDHKDEVAWAHTFLIPSHQTHAGKNIHFGTMKCWPNNKTHCFYLSN